MHHDNEAAINIHSLSKKQFISAAANGCRIRTLCHVSSRFLWNLAKHWNGIRSGGTNTEVLDGELVTHDRRSACCATLSIVWFPALVVIQHGKENVSGRVERASNGKCVVMKTQCQRQVDEWPDNATDRKQTACRFWRSVILMRKLIHTHYSMSFYSCSISAGGFFLTSFSAILRRLWFLLNSFDREERRAVRWGNCGAIGKCLLAVFKTGRVSSISQQWLARPICRAERLLLLWLHCFSA